MVDIVVMVHSKDVVPVVVDAASKAGVPSRVPSRVPNLAPSRIPCQLRIGSG